MSRLEEAMRTANERKLAAMGIADDNNMPAQIISGSDFSDRAVFSGYDLDIDELASKSTEVAEFYSWNARFLGLCPLFTSCWCDGILTGLLLAASLPPTSGPGNAGAGGEES